MDNMWISSGWLWINRRTAPLYVSGCARVMVVFDVTVTLWIAAFRWRVWLPGLLKTKTKLRKRLLP